MDVGLAVRGYNDVAASAQPTRIVNNMFIECVRQLHHKEVQEILLNRRVIVGAHHRSRFEKKKHGTCDCTKILKLIKWARQDADW